MEALPTEPTAESVAPIAPSEMEALPTEPTAESVAPIAPSEMEALPTEPTAQSVPPIAPPELVTEQKPDRKTDDQVVAEKKHHKEFTEGDRVVIAEVGNIHHGQRGKVIYVGYGSRETDYKIKLDKVSHHQEVITVAVPNVSHTPILMQLKAEGGAPC
jgi:hypothetical protein